MLFALLALSIVVLVVSYVGGKAASSTKHKKDIVSKAKLKDRWVQKGIDDYSMSIVNHQFESTGKNVYDRRRNYTDEFLNSVEVCKQELIKNCFTDGMFSDEFCSFIYQNYFGSWYGQDVFYSTNLSQIFSEYMETMKLDSFVHQSEAMTPDDFFELRKRQDGDIVGVYIIYNDNRNMYYVGQSKRVFFRVNQHFTGHGNGDVYADYKYGDSFKIQIITLANSGYSDLDMLEKDLIKKYDAYNSGYNRTAGNG